jgi:hypothetical protein
MWTCHGPKRLSAYASRMYSPLLVREVQIILPSRRGAHTGTWISEGPCIFGPMLVSSCGVIIGRSRRRFTRTGVTGRLG